MTSPLDFNVLGADPRNYGVAKRASLWVRPYGSIDDADWDEIGNLVDLNAVPDMTLLEHKSNRRGAFGRDRIEISERKFTLDIKVDEVKTSNLIKAFGSSIGKETSSATVREGRIVKNRGAAVSVSLEMADVDTLIVRSTNEEGARTTYEAEPFTTDSTDDTAGNTFNNTTNPIVIAAASYPGTTFVIGTIIKVASEFLEATAVGGGNVTLKRGVAGSTPAAHANGVSIFKSGGGDYIFDAATAAVVPLIDGALEDEDDVPEFHVYFTKDVDTEAFELYDGTPIKLEVEYQVLTTKGARIVIDLPHCVVTNKGSITFGQGDKWIEMPLNIEALLNSAGKIGTFHVIAAAATL